MLFGDRDRGIFVSPGVLGARSVAFSGLRWELKNLGATSILGGSCSKVTVLGEMPGDPTRTYNVAIRLRGVVELAVYTGGTNDGAFFQTGGALASITLPSPVPLIGAADGGSNLARNVYSLTIGNPPTTYYVNAMASSAGDVGARDPYRTMVIDYTKTIPIVGGSSVTMVADPSDGLERLNQDANLAPNLVPGVPPYPAAYDGQFCQLDVVGVT